MYPNRVKRILIQNCAPKPTCKNTPNGGIKTDNIMRIKSSKNTVGLTELKIKHFHLLEYNVNK